MGITDESPRQTPEDKQWRDYLQVSPSPARSSCFSIVLRPEVDAYDATKRVALERHSTDSVDKNFALDERATVSHTCTAF